VGDWRYAVGVGANCGDRRAAMARAAEAIDASGMARVVARSSLIENPPVGGPPGQGPFLNGAWIVESGYGPHQLLGLLQRVEAELGRVRTVVWGPRTLDLDLLLREDGLTVSSTVLSLPHPRMTERDFVLRPLAEIAGGWIHPGTGLTISALAARRAR
jgi:2-amino-4-hydroxy-6-hydroxymethyldihydropteridine diphosphokinase